MIVGRRQFLQTSAAAGAASFIATGHARANAPGAEVRRAFRLR
jgi:hypothetical protein